jgi:hypothetical protein
MPDQHPDDLDHDDGYVGPDWERLDAEREGREYKPGARKANGHDSEPPLIKSSAQFVAEFVPPDYIVDGLLQEGFLYSLTGATGAGKTAITLPLAASTALGAPFAGRETKKRRVLYLAGENPTDVRMRWIALSQRMDFDPDTIEVYFIDKVFKSRANSSRQRRGRVGFSKVPRRDPVLLEVS